MSNGNRRRSGGGSDRARDGKRPAPEAAKASAGSDTPPVNAEPVAETEILRAPKTVTPDRAEDAEILSDAAAPKKPAENARDPRDDHPNPSGSAADRRQRAAAWTGKTWAAASARAQAWRAAAGERGSSFTPALIGAVIGGGLVLLSQPLFMGAATPPLTDTAITRIGQVEGRATAWLSELEDRLAAQEAAMAELKPEGALGAQAAGDRAELRVGMDQLAEALNAAADRVGRLETEALTRESSQAAALDGVREQVASLAALASTRPGALETVAAGDGAEVRAALEARLAMAEGALLRLGDRIDGVARTLAPKTAVERIDALETRVAPLEKTPADIGALEGRVSALESEARAFAQGEAAVGLAFGAVSQAVAGSAPYADALATLERVAGVEAEPALREPAGEGLASAGALAARFGPASRAALAAIARAEADQAEGFTDALTRRLSSFVVIRRTEETEGGDPMAVLSRAGARIQEGDTAAAVAEVDALPEPARAAMGDWLVDANRRAEAEAALDRMRAALLPTE